MLLRDVRLDLADGSNDTAVMCPYAFVNRYSVERVTADLMLGFFFPGAVMDGLPDPEPVPAAAASDAAAPADGISEAVQGAPEAAPA